MQPQDLVVSDLDLGLQVFHDLLVLYNALLHLEHYLVELLAALVGSSHLLSPLVLVGQQVLLDLEAESSGVDVLSTLRLEGTLLYRRRQFYGLGLLQEVIV